MSTNNLQHITPHDQKRAEMEGAEAYRGGDSQNPYKLNAELSDRNYELFHAWKVGYDMEQDYWQQPGCSL